MRPSVFCLQLLEALPANPRCEDNEVSVQITLRRWETDTPDARGAWAGLWRGRNGGLRRKNMNTHAEVRDADGKNVRRTRASISSSIHRCEVSVHERGPVAPSELPLHVTSRGREVESRVSKPPLEVCGAQARPRYRLSQPQDGDNE